MADPVAVLTYYAVRKWPVPDINVSAGKLNRTLEAAKRGGGSGLEEVDNTLDDLEVLAREIRDKYRKTY